MATGTVSPPPLTPAVFAILLALAEGDKHGYGIMKEARTPQGGGVNMGPGTLYGTIDRLIRDGMIEERRRYYRVKALGRTTLAAELERLNAAVTSARSLGLLAPGGRS
jgi:DNA-binding PadR family transcriptional regulator